MSSPVHLTSARQSGAVLAAARQRRNGGRPGSLPGNAAERAVLAIQAGAGNRAATAVVQRARSAAEATAPENAGLPEGGHAPEGAGPQVTTNAPAAKKSYRDRIAAALDKAKKHFEFLDTHVKNIEVPVHTGFLQHANTTADEGLRHSAAASGVAAGSESAVAEAVGTALAGMEATKARKDAKKHGEGAAYHGAAKKYKVKRTDAVVGAASSASNALTAARELLRATATGVAGGVAEASGVGSGVAALAKAARAGRRIHMTVGKFRALDRIEVPEYNRDEALARLNQARTDALWASDQAYGLLENWDHEGPDRLERLGEIIDVAWDGAQAARDAAREAARRAAAEGEPAKDAERRESLHTALTYARHKQGWKITKQAVTALGESTKVAGGAVTIAAAAGGAALASTPVGWGLAAAAAGLTLTVSAYKGVRAGMKRYEGVRHPERWAAEGTTPAEPASRGDALAEALKFWKKVENGERQAMARKIYALAAGPDIEGSRSTPPELRQSARELLVALKAGHENQKLTASDWQDSLNDPDKKAAWIKEIAEQLSSA